METIKTFEDACAKLNLSQEQVNAMLSTVDSPYTKSQNAYLKLMIIAEALNDGWKPDWKDGTQRKYQAYFYAESDGGFSYTYCNAWTSSTDVPSRLCFKNYEICEHAATTFIDIFNDYLA